MSSLSPGARLDRYEILALIGAGGMGEVYEALDTRLNRKVAIKLLPPHFSENVEMKQRFEREAQAIAGLNHPYICTLHDMGRHNDIEILVMGQTITLRQAGQDWVVVSVGLWIV
jgi:eukaryotic-like serine/threonine-protein kinase